MCCEECPRYKKCEEDSHLKDNCCPKCPEYHDCATIDDRRKKPSRDSYEYDNEDYF